MIHLFEASLMSFSEIYSKLTMLNELYDVEFPKQTKTLIKVTVNKISDIWFLRYFCNRLKLLDIVLVKCFINWCRFIL